MSPAFGRYIGIDYSGRAEATAGTSAIQVYEAQSNENPHAVRLKTGRSWNRKALAEWLVDQLQQDCPRFIAGIDHAFSFPVSYMQRYGLTTWPEFLADFVHHWPAHQQTVESLRQGNPRSGQSNEFRLAEQWTSSAKSIFLFDVNGSVAKSTHSGLPWLQHIRQHYGDKVFFWPFDGWTPPPDRHVIVEVYPSLFRNRYRRAGLKGDALDAFAVAQWLEDMDGRGALPRYLDPPLSAAERQVASLEGWILGVS